MRAGSGSARREENKTASRTKVREATDRGSTLFYHSSAAPDAGRTEGFCIPRAPGRTSQAPPQTRLQPVTRPLCSSGILLLFPIITLFDSLQYISRICPGCQGKPARREKETAGLQRVSPQALLPFAFTALSSYIFAQYSMTARIWGEIHLSRWHKSCFQISMSKSSTANRASLPCSTAAWVA